MKKVLGIIAILFLSAIVIYFEYGYHNISAPDTYYQVYLDDQMIGVIDSKREMDKYIQSKGEEIKNKVIAYQEELKTNPTEERKKQLTEYINKYIDYSKAEKYGYPYGVEIQKISTYNGETTTAETIYEKMNGYREMTIEGYQITIKKEGNDDVVVFVTDPSIFEEAVTKTIEAFVGKDSYEEYINKTQNKISTVGTYIENIYVDESITIKKKNIPVDKEIYNDSAELSQYLLFQKDELEKTYKVKLGETIETVAEKNDINTEEFLISNPKYTSANNLLTAGEIVKIGEVDPLISVVVEKTIIKDNTNKYDTEYKKDSSIAIGNDITLQKGKNGIDRVEYVSKEINGTINYAIQYNRVEILPPTTEVIAVGTRYIPSVGSLRSWGWPTERGWIITSPYGWRYINGAREFHQGMDIAGAGSCGSSIYASNNGTIEKAGWHPSYGYYIMINHNNGYYTLYAHMSKLLITKIGYVVYRGEKIGLMGETGRAYGCHLHFEVHIGTGWNRVNPYRYLFKWCIVF